MQSCFMHSGCGISCTSSASRQPVAPLQLPARSFANFRHCNLAGHSRKQHQSLDCRWQLNAAVCSHPPLAGVVLAPETVTVDGLSLVQTALAWLYHGSVYRLVLPAYTHKDSFLADYGAELKPGHRLATRLRMVRDHDRLETRPHRGREVCSTSLR